MGQTKEGKSHEQSKDDLLLLKCPSATLNEDLFEFSNLSSSYIGVGVTHHHDYNNTESHDSAILSDQIFEIPGPDNAVNAPVESFRCQNHELTRLKIERNSRRRWGEFKTREWLLIAIGLFFWKLLSNRAILWRIQSVTLLVKG